MVTHGVMRCPWLVPAPLVALVSCGAGTADRDELGLTALMYAAQYNPDPDVTRALLAAGASVR